MQAFYSYRAKPIIGWLLLVLLLLAAKTYDSKLPDPYQSSPGTSAEIIQERVSAGCRDLLDEAFVESDAVSLHAFRFLRNNDRQPKRVNPTAFAGLPAIQITHTALQGVSIGYLPAITLRPSQSSDRSATPPIAVLAFLSTVVLRT